MVSHSSILKDRSNKPWSVAEAYRYCRSLARQHYENFPVGSLIISKALRNHVAAVYAFARTADDFADEQVNTGKELALLTGWQKNLDLCYEGKAQFPTFVALADTAKRFDLPKQLFVDLLDAFKQDVTVKRYETFPEVLDYCRRSANPIGRLVLLLYEHKEEDTFRWSDAICTALQLTNFWQDIAIDWEKGRTYIPQEDFRRFGYPRESLASGEVNEAFRNLMDFELRRTQDLFDEGKPLLKATRGRLRLELTLVWLGGTRILTKLRNNGFDMFRKRPTLTTADTIGMLVQALRRFGKAS